MLKDAEDGEKYVRLAVHGGGCSGLSYGLGFEVEPKEDDT
ncbi:iron-sulfur cluster assembly accessory protein, partial [Bacillus cereus]|nr:iron-sulfur cluster assembly accessory protein [Bacillus cereus]